jgi:hypothetical protein
MQDLGCGLRRILLLSTRVNRPQAAKCRLSGEVRKRSEEHAESPVAEDIR